MVLLFINIGCMRLWLLKSQLVTEETAITPNSLTGFVIWIVIYTTVIRNWYIIHPEFSHLSDKNLHDQARRIIMNKIVMKTQFSTDSNTNWNSQSDNVDISNNETVNESRNLVNNTPTNINRIMLRTIKSKNLQGINY